MYIGCNNLLRIPKQILIRVLIAPEIKKVCFCSYNRVVNVSSQLGSLSCVSPPLQKQFSSLTLTESEIVALMEKYLRYT